MFQIGGGHAPKDGSAQGKPKAPARAPRRVKVQVELEPRQRDKLALLGGDAWVREQIEAARIPNAFSDE